jgi:prepilin-type N-terminal cleavage/methylation domain-containing protein
MLVSSARHNRMPGAPGRIPDGMTPSRNRSASRGFTLIELLTVIVIISMLVGIAMPSLLSIKSQIMRSTCFATLRSIEGGIALYSKDFRAGKLDPDFLKANPPSSRATPGFIGWDGREILAFLMLGYADNPGTAGKPNLTDFTNDDGCNGPGFRLVERGTVYGPYVSPDTPAKRDENNHTVFIDAYDNSFYYCRFDGATSKYLDDDNSGGPASVMSYATTDHTTNAIKLYRRDYILFSKGPDGRWNAVQADGTWDPTTDDITNFLMER